jgi:anti-sigma-K factor RskA
MDDVSQLDEVRTRLAELPADVWTGTAERPKLTVVAADRKERKAPPPERRRSRIPMLLALLAVAVVALVVVLASNGASEKSKSTARTSVPSSSPKPVKKQKPAKPVAKTTQLAALGTASGATGTAALTEGGKRMTINASGLPGGAYQVWLYNSVIDAASLTKVRGTKLVLDLKLPSNASHYRYVDVSREPADGNPNHSGDSVLRVPLSKLAQR